MSSVALALTMAGGQTPAGQPGGTSDSQALVQELRALRETIEQVLATNVRVQLLMGRLQLQEARIQTLIRQARDVESQVSSVAAERDLMLQQRRTFERTANETVDPQERAFAKEQAAGYGERLKQLENRHAALLAEQANAQQLLLSEQNRWGDFNLRLEELERLLSAPRR
jgi:hypothetical protein